MVPQVLVKRLGEPVGLLYGLPVGDYLPLHQPSAVR
jgi:hypothetical protein